MVFILFFCVIVTYINYITWWFARFVVSLQLIMIHGHGDDTYLYEDIRMNFSSNIFSHADLTELECYLQSQIDVIRQYPEPDAHALQLAIAEKRRVPASCVLVTNGATDAIYLVAQMLQHRGVKHYDIPQPSFSEYEDACQQFGITPASSVASNQSVVTWLCSPNNPTGQVACSFPTSAFVVEDRSYEAFTQQPLMTPAEAIDRGNVIQIHSMTKTYAVPGLRLGYVIASEDLICAMRRFMHPWSVNALAVKAGLWLLRHETIITDMPAYLSETQRLRTMLNEVPGIRVMPTDTCFMLAEIIDYTAADLKHYLADQHHILIRDASNFKGLTVHHFRVSTQLPSENDELVHAVRAFIAQATGAQTL